MRRITPVMLAMVAAASLAGPARAELRCGTKEGLDQIRATARANLEVYITSKAPGTEMRDYTVPKDYELVIKGMFNTGQSGDEISCQATLVMQASGFQPSSMAIAYGVVETEDHEILTRYDPGDVYKLLGRFLLLNPQGATGQQPQEGDAQRSDRQYGKSAPEMQGGMRPEDLSRGGPATDLGGFRVPQPRGGVAPPARTPQPDDPPWMVVKDAAEHATTGRWTADQVEQAYFSRDLLSFMKRIDQEHWRNFDSDPMTGSQDPGALTVTNVSSQGDHGARVIFSDADRYTYGVDFTVVREGGTWKIDDIYYDQPNRKTFRQVMTWSIPR